jgi:hypothetical protein
MQVCKIRCPRLDACHDPIERESPVIEQDDRAFIVGGFGDAGCPVGCSRLWQGDNVSPANAK